MPEHFSPVDRLPDLDLPFHFRLVSIVRLPDMHRRGIYNEAAIYHAGSSLKVSWHSCQVDSRLAQGRLVVIRGEDPAAISEDGNMQIAGLDLIDKPLQCINPFEMVPPNWVGDHTLTQRACALWRHLSPPFQLLINTVFWDPGRFFRFLNGPASPFGDARGRSSNFRHAVETAEHVLRLSHNQEKISHSVLVAAAILHDAGKADDYRLSSQGSVLSERGRKVGYRYTILEWLAVARASINISERQYLALLHALIAMSERFSVTAMPSKSIEAIMLSVADRMNENPASISF